MTAASPQPEVVSLAFRSAAYSVTGTADYSGELGCKTIDPFTGAEIWQIDKRGARTPAQLAAEGHDLGTIVAGFNAALAIENDGLKSDVATLTAARDGLAADVATLTQTLAARDARIAELEAAMTAHADATSAAEPEVASEPEAPSA